MQITIGKLKTSAPLLSIFWALFIFILCVIPGKVIPKYTWADLLSIDKLIHCALFFIQALLILNAFAKTNNKFYALKQNMLTLIVCIIYGGMLELMQTYLLTDRYGSWFDFLANTTGAIFGVLLFKKTIKLFDKKATANIKR